MFLARALHEFSQLACPVGLQWSKGLTGVEGATWALIGWPVGVSFF